MHAESDVADQAMTDLAQLLDTAQPEALRLDIGCGTNGPRPGFVGIDRKSGLEAYPLKDDRGDAFPDEIVDEIVASHVLEHFPHGQALDVLREWVRVLKPGGRIRIAVPDFEKCVALYREDEEAVKKLFGDRIGAGALNYMAGMVMGYVFGGQTDEDDYHRAAFDEGLLTEMMRAVGLSGIRRWESELQDGASLPISLNLEGFKRPPVKITGVAVVASRPRLGFTLHEWCAHNALYPHNLRPALCTGVFWSHGLTQLMEAAIEAGYKYVLTLDHDTAYTKQDVEDLFDLAERNPQADAICATQMLREGDRILAYIKQEDGSCKRTLNRDELNADLLPLTSAHFGLTIFRCASFAKMERPWFCEAPDKDGRWGDGRTDADSSFWRQWGKGGNTLFQANRVIVGHQVEMIAWPDRTLRPVYQPASEFMREGRKPTGVLR